MSYWEPDDDGGAFEAAYEAGFWSPDDIDELREILKLVERKLTPGDRAMAALVLLDHKLNPPKCDELGRLPPTTPEVLWATTLLGGGA